MNKPATPEIKEAPELWVERYGGNKMLIPTPRIIDAAVRKVPEGSLISNTILRQYLAEQHHADFACPMTTGIFLRIVAEAAEEARAEGKTDITPYWRVVKDDGTLNPKFPGGLEQQSAYLSNEGFKIVPKGRKNLMVKDFRAFFLNNIDSY
jgi:hypothetical protein